MTRSLYLLGGPGVGKSTLLASLMQGWTPGPYERLTEREMFGHYLEHELLGTGLYLGRLREEYPGTDALSMSVSPQAVLWLDRMRPDLSWIFGEGRRLGNPKFLEKLNERTRLTVLYLVLDPESAEIRRDLREQGEKGLNPKGHSSRKGASISASNAQSSFTVAANTVNACREMGIEVIDLDSSVPAPQLYETAKLVLAESFRV